MSRTLSSVLSASARAFRERQPQRHTPILERRSLLQKVVASLLPKQLEIKEAPFDGVSDEELAALIVAARSALGLAKEGGDGTEEPHRPELPN